MKNALVEVIGRINRLPPLPRDADRPSVSSGERQYERDSVLFFVQLQPGRRVRSRRSDASSKTRCARGSSRYRASRVQAMPVLPTNVRIHARPGARCCPRNQLFRRGKPRGQRHQRVGGQLDVGRRQYTCVSPGVFSPEQLGGWCWRGAKAAVRLTDLATIDCRSAPRQFFGYQNGNRPMRHSGSGPNGANVLATLRRGQSRGRGTARGSIKATGSVSSSPSSVAVHSRAVRLLSENLVVGALLALIVVWCFMREWRVTLLIGLPYPVCLCATFIALGSFRPQSQRHFPRRARRSRWAWLVEGAIGGVGTSFACRGRHVAGGGDRQGRSAGRRCAVASNGHFSPKSAPVSCQWLFLKDVEGQLFGDLALTNFDRGGDLDRGRRWTLLPVALSFAAQPPTASQRLWAGLAKAYRVVLRVTDTRPKQLSWIAGLLLFPLLLTGGCCRRWITCPRSSARPLMHSSIFHQA